MTSGELSIGTEIKEEFLAEGKEISSENAAKESQTWFGSRTPKIKSEEESSDDDIPLSRRFLNSSGTVGFLDLKCEIIEDEGSAFQRRSQPFGSNRKRQPQKQSGSKTKCKTGNGTKLECHLCGEKYFDLKTHLEKHAKKPSHDCDICKKSFTFKGKLLDHKKFEHGIDFACEICKKKFNSKDNIRIHMSVHATESKFVCQICGFSSKRKNGLEIHMRRHEDNWVCRCTNCGKGFFSYTKLAEHMNNHTGERPFTCDQCGCSYASSNTLWSHARKVHPELFNNLNSCEFCNKIFMKSKSLQAHVEAFHSKGDHFECDVCTKTFTKETSLVFHRRTHTNERPFVCNICGGAFTANKFLRKHRSIHTERKFKCRFCYKKFVHEKFLVSHEQKHSEVKSTY